MNKSKFKYKLYRYYRRNIMDKKKSINDRAAKMRNKYRLQNLGGKVSDIKEKYCSECKETLDVSKFSKDVTKKDGYQAKCKTCKLKGVKSYDDLDENKVAKICNGCGDNKTLINYKKSKAGRMGRDNLCKICRSKQRKGLNYKAKQAGTKKCSNCGNEKNVDDFPKDKNNKDGLNSRCKICNVLKTKLSSSKFSGFISKIYNDAVRNAKRRNLYFGITKDDIVDIYNSQSSKCAITNINMEYSVMKERQEGDPHILNPYNMSIDRIDSKKGYVKNNIQLVCAFVNRIKLDMSSLDMYELANKVKYWSLDTDFNRLCSIMNKPKVNSKCVINDDIKKHIKYKYDCMIHNAKKRNIKVFITIDDLLELYKKQNGKCNLSGDMLTYNKSDSDISIDRINSINAYSKNNVQLITNTMNFMKSDAPNDIFVKFCTDIGTCAPEKFCIFPNR